jgi:hypothetical protein
MKWQDAVLFWRMRSVATATKSMFSLRQRELNKDICKGSLGGVHYLWRCSMCNAV